MRRVVGPATSLVAAGLAVGAVIVGAGCGGDAESTTPASPPERAAASATACDPTEERRSIARSLTVINLLPVQVSLGVSNVNCAQWSGVSTPYAWNGVTLAAVNGGRAMRMEMARGTSPTWTFTVRAPGALTPFAVRCQYPSYPCGYDVQGAPGEAWSTSAVIATDVAMPDWAATPAQRRRIDNIDVNNLVLWSDGAKVHASSRGGQKPDYTPGALS